MTFEMCRYHVANLFQCTEGQSKENQWKEGRERDNGHNSVFVCVCVWWLAQCASIPQVGWSNPTRGKRFMPFFIHFVL